MSSERHPVSRSERYATERSRAPDHASVLDVEESLVVVLIHPDVFGGSEAAHEAVVDEG